MITLKAFSNCLAGLLLLAPAGAVWAQAEELPKPDAQAAELPNLAPEAESRRARAQLIIDEAAKLFAQGRYGQATSALESALELTPKSATIWTARGWSLFYAGKMEEAPESFDQAIGYNPTLVRALNGKGMTLFSLGRYPESAKLYDRALRISPERELFWRL